jgi:hypothetical protein
MFKTYLYFSIVFVVLFLVISSLGGCVSNTGVKTSHPHLDPHGTMRE